MLGGLEAREIALTAAEAAGDLKARDVIVLDVSHKTVVTDFFVICSTDNRVQLKAVVEKVKARLKDRGVVPLHQEGLGGGWVVLDYGGAVVHLFLQEQREFYGLERLWRDAPEIELERA